MITVEVIKNVPDERMSPRTAAGSMHAYRAGHPADHASCLRIRVGRGTFSSRVFVG